MTDYKTMIAQAEGILDAEGWYVAALSNLSALVMDTLPDLNWAGFYFVRDGGLTVGPFQGKPACIRIAAGKGVCGTAVSRNETVALSPTTQDGPSPVHGDGGEIRAVLDIDSVRKDRFSEADREGLEALVRAIEGKVKWA